MTSNNLSKILIISPEKCTGCRTCEIICSYGKDGKFNPKNAAVSVIAYEEAAVAVPMMCMQCEDAACVKVCPVGATCRADSGAVEVDPGKCIGCKLCISACPMGNISYNSIAKKIVKCDLCGGEAKCAQFCPSGAIQFKDANATDMKKKKIIAEKFKELFEEVSE